MKVTTQVRGIPELMSILSVKEQRRVFINATNELGALVFKEAKAFVRKRYAIQGGLTRFGFKRTRAAQGRINNIISAPGGRQNVARFRAKQTKAGLRFQILKSGQTHTWRSGKMENDRVIYTTKGGGDKPLRTLSPMKMINNKETIDIYNAIMRRYSNRVLNKRLRELIRKKAYRRGRGA